MLWTRKGECHNKPLMIITSFPKLLKCKIPAISLVETACIFMIFVIAILQISMERETRES